MNPVKFSADGNVSKIITDRLADGGGLPKAVVSLSKGWVGVGLSRVKSVPTIGPHDLSPTEFGYKTVVWIGRVVVNLKK